MTSSVLFVCLGNICRSPLAEAAFRREVERAGLDVRVDSAGTGTWNLGKAPDPRSQTVARREGLDISERRARQVTLDDFDRFDEIVALDPQNLHDLEAIRPVEAKAKLSLLLDHAAGREGQAVADPYRGDAMAFDASWADIEAGVRGLAAGLTTVRSA